jgi:iron complex outermembrane receptor protein
MLARAEPLILEEIIVEAQKKVETVTETPMTINAISGEQFEKYASFNFQDLARTTPALSFDVGVTPDIRMRGVSTVTLAAVSLRTTIYQDGALIEQPRVIFDPQYDIERFEVLKGPQGTLYGKSSPTGAINIRTRNPNLSELDGYVSGSVGAPNFLNTQFGVSTPIIKDKLAVRISALYDDNETSGVENVATGRDAHSRASGTRVTFLWEPGDNFSGRFSYQYREKKENLFYTNDGAGFDFDDDKLNSNLNDYNNYIDQLSILELNYGINDNLSIVSVAAYQEQSFDNYQDIDGVTGSLNSGTGSGQSLVGSEQFTNAEISPQFQEDLRLISEDNDIWDWQLGLYYQRTGSQTKVNVTTYNAALSGYVDVNTVLESIQENYAFYTHNTFKVNDDFNIIAGLRYQQSRRFTSQPTVIYTNNGGLLREVNGIPKSIRTLMTYPVTGTLKAQYFFAPELVGYATVDRAFRGGGANVDISSNLPSDFSEIPEESANSVEIGLKGTFEDQRGRFAISAFDQIYKNFQQDFQNLTINAYPPLLQNMVQSAKEAETRGIELACLVIA